MSDLKDDPKFVNITEKLTTTIEVGEEELMQEIKEPSIMKLHTHSKPCMLIMQEKLTDLEKRQRRPTL